MIPVILMRGCKKYPSQSDLNRRLQYLYSADIDARNNLVGEYQVFGFSSNMLNDRFTSDVKTTNEMAQLLCDIIFDPYLEKGIFSMKYTESEKRRKKYWRTKGGFSRKQKRNTPNELVLHGLCDPPCTDR
jgi:hypothetical protein